MKIKISLIFIVLLQLLCNSFVQAQQKPHWLVKRPNGGRMLLYGIGEASLNEDKYQERAKERALADIASQIEVNVQSNSLLNLTSRGDNVSRSYDQKIKTSTSLLLVGQSVFGTYNDGERYYVCYELNKLDYDEYKQKQRDNATRKGLEYLNSAKRAEQNGNLLSALEMYSNGLKSIQTYLNEDLEYNSYGANGYLGKDLYEGISSLWDGVSIRTDKQSVDVVALEAINVPVKVTIEKAGTPLSSLPVKAVFTQGNGHITQKAVTSSQGNCRFVLSQISSKLATQTVKFQIDANSITALRAIPFSIRNSCVNRWSSAEGSLMIKVKQKRLTAYIESETGAAYLRRTVESIITRNYFDVAQEKSTADLVVKISGQVVKGEVIPSGLYDLQKYFATADIKLINQHSNASITNVLIPDVPSVAKVGTPKAQAEAGAWRALNSKLSAELTRAMKSVTIDTSNPLPKPVAQNTQKKVSNGQAAPKQDNIRVKGGLLAYYNFTDNSIKNKYGESLYNGIKQGGGKISFVKNDLSPAGCGAKLSSNSYIALPSHPLSQNGSYSISVWVKTSSGGVIVGRSYSFASGREPGVFGIQNNGHFFLTGERNTRGIDLDANQLVLDGDWHHLCLTTRVKDSSNRHYQIYVDGSIVAQGVSKIDEMREGRTGFIGHMENQPEDFKGEIDNLRIYEKALTAEEVSQLYDHKQ